MFTYLILWKHQPAPRRQAPEGSFLTAALNWWSQRDLGSWIHYFVDPSHDVLQNQITHWGLRIKKKYCLGSFPFWSATVLYWGASDWTPVQFHSPPSWRTCENHLPRPAGCTLSNATQTQPSDTSLSLFPPSLQSLAALELSQEFLSKSEALPFI